MFQSTLGDYAPSDAPLSCSRLRHPGFNPRSVITHRATCEWISIKLQYSRFQSTLGDYAPSDCFIIQLPPGIKEFQSTLGDYAPSDGTQGSLYDLDEMFQSTLGDYAPSDWYG